MKINFNSFGLGISGGNRTIFELSNRLVDRGHKVTITTVGRNKKEYKWFHPIKAKINYVQLSLTQKAFRKFILKKSAFDYDYEKVLLHSIPDCDINVATHCLTSYPTYLSGIGKPFYLVQNYEPWFFCDRSSQLKAELSYLLPLKKLVVSQWLKDKVDGTVIGNGVNLNTFYPRGVRLIGPPFKIMALMRGISWKGDSKVTEVYQALKEYGCELAIPNKVTDEELAKTYSSSHVFLFLSNFEGFGLPPLEAMACGTPVVTTNCTEFTNHLENAYVVSKASTSKDIAKAVEKVLFDMDLANRLIKNGFKTALKFDYENVVDKVEQVFKEE